MRFGTWNVRSLHRAGAVILVVHINLDLREVGMMLETGKILTKIGTNDWAYVRMAMNLQVP